MKVRTPQSIGFFPYDGNVVGGAMIGVGMALTGACPGTVLVQSGISTIQSGSYALLGGIVGGLVYVTALPYLERLKQFLRPKEETSVSPPPSRSHTVLLSTSKQGSPTIHATLNISPLTVLCAWEAVCLLILQLAHAYDPSQGRPQLAGLTSPVLGGLAIGAAQAAVIVLTRRAVGCSKAYADIGHYLHSTIKADKINTSAIKYLLEPTMIFAIGVISAGAVLGGVYPPTLGTSLEDSVIPIKALVGGALMAFGASVAGGCTSGHGISGLVTFSLASFVSVAAMFGSGIATALMIS